MSTVNAVGNSLTGSTGSGAFVGATSPTLVTPALGTPASGTLTNCTGLPVAGGGTGASSATAYAVLCGGTTSTSAFQSIASLGAVGTVLMSNGAAALPTMVDKATQYGISVNRATLQTITTNTYTKLQLNVEVTDPANAYDNVTNYRHTPTISGTYQYTASIVFDTTIGDQKAALIAIYKNGVRYVSNAVNNSGTTTTQALICAPVPMNGTTDYVEAYGYHEKGSNANTTANAAHNFLLGALL